MCEKILCEEVRSQ
jgi:hypothetical protein